MSTPQEPSSAQNDIFTDFVVVLILVALLIGMVVYFKVYDETPPGSTGAAADAL